MTSPGPGPLAGIRVLDFSIMIAGPYGGRLLADAGAEVVKVEPPGGDPMRRRAPLRDGQSRYFGALNAGKESLVLDLKDPVCLDQARTLVGQADVIIENFRPGVMTRLGLGYAECRELNPRLIYCSVSGYGQTGPKAGFPAYAQVVHAVSGFDLTNMGYQRSATEPPSTGIFVADVMAGQCVYAGVLTGLMGRTRSGVGDHVDLALCDIMMSTLVYETQAAQDPENSPPKTVYRPCRAGDEFVLISAVTDRNVHALMEAMGRPELKSDARFAGMTSREIHWEEWLQEVEDWSAPQDAGVVEKLLGDHGVPCTRYRTVAQALADPQIEARGTLRRARDRAGSFDFVGPPWQLLDSNRPAESAVVSELGSGNEAILGSL